ncbi:MULTISPECIES: DNA polymerase III subunit beta [Lysinibacillus]|uniref:DNA polymerase III subunit beta n=1 Tax=Lysinibacillus TaxID=400634 RepID=UPI00214C8DF8|nr:MULTISPECIES: DNA polymerase III subunit beta [Lysinibacillus]UUV25889.1 DNA polymerase III subunit beta [Lysinibacillus sp. FN11]UYB48762.1 DNA polymerase III subunit beta [Lysinibacillus capsici]
MKTTINRIELLEGLKKLGHIIDGKTSIPILTGVKISTSTDGKLQLIGGSTIAIASVEIETIHTETNGSLVLSYKKFTDFLKKSKANNIEIETLDNNQSSIKAGNIDYKLMYDDSSNYPLLPKAQFEYMNLDVNEYKRIISNTAFTVAKSDSRPVLKGISIRTDSNKLNFVGTDSHRLGRYTIDTELENIDVVPDGKMLEKSIKMLNKNTKSITIGIDENYTLIQFDDVNLFIKNIEGNYPDVNRLIPDNYTTEIKIDSKQTIESVSMLSTIAKEDRNNVIRMELNGKIEMYTNSPEIGSMTAKLEGEKQGEDLKISMNAVYLDEAIKAINEPKTSMRFSGSMRPFVALSNDYKAMQLILPVRTY